MWFDGVVKHGLLSKVTPDDFTFSVNFLLEFGDLKKKDFVFQITVLNV